MANTRTVAFARVSSKAQEEEGYSLDAQLKVLREYCRERGLNVVTEFRISETASKNERRTVFREMLRYIEKNKITNLVVEKTDRLTRNFRDAIVVDDWLEANQQHVLHMVKEGLVIHKYSRSDTKLMWNIYLSLSKKYTDNLREEAMKGWYEKLEQGWMPTPPPPGYKTALADGKKIHVIDEERAFLVERAFNLYLDSDQNIQTVTNEVGRLGLTSRKDKPLTKSSIHKMLRNTFYIGTIHFNGKDYPGAHETLLNNDLFCAVQLKLGERRQTKIIRHNPLFKGMLKCSHCGGVVTWQCQKGRYYGSCQRHNEGCKGRRLLREDRLEVSLLIRLDEIDASSAGLALLHALTNILQVREQPYIGQHRLSVMKAIEQQLRRCERMEDCLYDDKLTGQISEEKYKQKVEHLHNEIDGLRIRLSRLEELGTGARVVTQEPTSLRELYDGESKVGRRIIMRELFIMTVLDGQVRFASLKE
ncbi:recombinase family protein [Candidatus Saccharibacteria bacterium]|nr:recombinase family protein [Candidatus Saccharibacteria bacterium]MBH1972844.1 recombinase family protein [Candidatus Saccharibacteria bacterium]MBH1991045.1 recombinase family protein [Candidatus Saccharibacteria bacterium]